MEIQNLPQLPLSTTSIRVVILLERQYLLVLDQSKLLRVLVQGIIRLEGVKKYTLLHLRNGNTMLSSRTLKVFDEILQKSDFLRIHKAYLTNMHCLEKHDEVQTLYATMQNRVIISISRRKRKNFK